MHAADLAERVTNLLSELDFTTTVTSGFRTSRSNKLAGGAKASAHMLGKACDLFDPNGAIANAIMAKPYVLDKYDLYCENPQYTKGWLHLDIVKRKNRIFIP